MADNAITLQGLSAITRFIGRSTFQTQDQYLVLGWFVITTNHPLKSVAVWLFPGTSLEKEPARVCPLGRDDSSRQMEGTTVRAVRALLEREPLKPPATQRVYPRRQTMRAVRALLGHKTLKSAAAQWIFSRAPSDSGVTKATKCIPLATRFFDVLTARVFQEKKP